MMIKCHIARANPTTTAIFLRYKAIIITRILSLPQGLHVQQKLTQFTRVLQDQLLLINTVYIYSYTSAVDGFQSYLASY